MNTRIKMLPQQIANQIAAGEVIERPASIVKELLENSLDAGAKAIGIELQKGGLSFIRVYDDGQGIHKDDLPLAVTQHATSKIESLNDLTHIASLGFRGEALASIASVATFKLTSKQMQDEHAWEIAFDKNGANIIPAAHPQGTTVEVHDLFHKIPVRRKFLKSERTEFQHIEDIVKRIALSHYAVAFKLSHNGKQMLSIPPADGELACKNRVAKILGNHFVEHAYFIDDERLGMRLSGWVLPAEHSRAHADMQYFFVNDRMVKDKLLNHAVRSAFQDVIVEGRYPAYLLYFQCEPTEVDVNVHPTKHEVRFQQTRMVHDFVQFSLQKLLGVGAEANKQQYDQPDFTPIETVSYNIREPAAVYQTQNVDKKPSTKALSFLAGQLIVAQMEEDLLLFDYVRAQRFINRHVLEKGLQNNSLVSQPLLIPELVNGNEQCINDLLRREREWQRFAITLQQASPTSITVRALPDWLRGCDLTSLLQALSQQTSEAEIVECLLSYSVIAVSLTVAEMENIINKLLVFSIDDLKQQKIIKILTTTDLSKLF